MGSIRRLTAFGLAMAAASVWAWNAAAQDKIRIAKSVSQPLAFAPVDVGIEKKIWAKHGFAVEVLIFAGDAKMQQAFVAKAIDFGLGSGPAMGFFAKGVPAKAVGVVANEPLSMGLTVAGNSKIKRPEDLKGSRIGITTNGSLTYWLARELSRRLGWGSDGIRTVPLGAISAQLAALKSGQIDGFVMSSSQGLMLEQLNEGRLLLEFGSYIKDFHTHVIIASDDMIQKRAGPGAPLSGRMEGSHRIHVQQQGRDGPDRAQGHGIGRGAPAAGIRPRDADDVAGPEVQREGPGGHRGFLHRAGNPADQAGHADALQRHVPSGPLTRRSSSNLVGDTESSSGA